MLEWLGVEKQRFSVRPYRVSSSVACVWKHRNAICPNPFVLVVLVKPLECKNGLLILTLFISAFTHNVWLHFDKTKTNKAINKSNRHRSNLLSLQSRHLKYLTVRQAGDGQRCQADGDVQKENVTSREIQMILTIPSHDTRTNLSPAKERKYSHNKGQSPDETNHVSHTSASDDGVITEGVVYCFKENGEVYKSIFIRDNYTVHYNSLRSWRDDG